jgi:dTDP-4-amino-4,6-dideoxygalactose transaminase
MMFPGGLSLGKEEEEAVIQVIRSKRLFRYYGPGDSESAVKELEERFAGVTKTKYALAVNSCTNGLITALLAAGVQPGDEVIIPAYTFVATPAAVVGANAIPVIVDIDDTFTIDPVEMEKNVTEKTKAVIPVHMRGEPCDMDKIMELAGKYNLKVIEDAAQANGGAYHGKPLGSIGEAGCFSFQYHKIITAGEGGIICTDSEELIDRSQGIHDTGANWRGSLHSIGSDGALGIDNFPRFPGYNFRMPEIIAALMLVQLERRQGLLDKMKNYSSKIRSVLSRYPGISLRRLHDPEGSTGICCMFTTADPKTAKEIALALDAEGIEAAAMGHRDVPDWHVYKNWKHVLNRQGNNDTGFPFTLSDRTYSEDMCPRTLDLLSRLVHLNISPAYTPEDIDEIITGLDKVLSADNFCTS